MEYNKIELMSFSKSLNTQLEENVSKYLTYDKELMPDLDIEEVKI